MSELYDDLNLADLTEEFDRLETGGFTNNILDKFVMMPKEGSVTVRLLPPAKGKRFYCDTRVHKLTFTNGNVKNVHCTRVLKKINGTKRWVDENPKDPCPLCKYYNSLWAEADKCEKEGSEDSQKRCEDFKKQARLIKPLERYYYNCIVRQQVNPKTEEVEKNVGPKILSIGKILHQKIIRAVVGDPANDEPSLGDISDPKSGRDLKVIKRIKGGFPDYSDSKFLDQSPLGDRDQIKTWFDALNELSALRRLIDHAEMSILLKKYLGLIPLDDAEEEEDVVSTPPPKANLAVEKPNKKSPVVAQAEQDLGGSGKDDDEYLSDEDFFKDIEDS